MLNIFLLSNKCMLNFNKKNQKSKIKSHTGDLLCKWSPLRISQNDTIGPQNPFWMMNMCRAKAFKKRSVSRHICAHMNKHCEILVSCSDEERNSMKLHEAALNCMQAHGTSCKLIKLQKVQETACKLRELHARSCMCM